MSDLAVKAIGSAHSANDFEHPIGVVAEASDAFGVFVNAELLHEEPIQVVAPANVNLQIPIWQLIGILLGCSITGLLEGLKRLGRNKISNRGHYSFKISSLGLL